MDSIETMFPPMVWKRGREYFNRARVQNVDIYNDYVSANVVGDETYHVKIFYDKSTILNMQCNCVYAKAGKTCKHMAAVLIQMAALGIVNITDPMDKKMNQNIEQLDDWQQVVEQFVGERYWINYNQKRKFDRAMCSILSNDIQTLTINNYKDILLHVSLMIKAMNKVVEEITIEDTIEVLPNLFHKLKQISLLGNGRDWAKQRSLETNRMDVLNVLIQHSFSMDEQGLKELDEHIQLANNIKNVQVVELCLEYHINLMLHLQYKEETIIASLDAYCSYPSVLDYVISYHVEHKNYKQAKELLSRYATITDIDDDKKDEMKDYLIEIAEAEKDHETIFQYIEEQLSNPRMDYPVLLAERLRNCFESKQAWKKALWEHSENLKIQAPYHKLLPFYLYLKEYDCFYELILQRYDLASLLEYMEELLEYDASMFQHVFYVLIKQEMEEANNASQYKDVLSYLQNFKMHAENQDACNEIIVYAKQHHQHKNLFMKYLKQLY